MVSYVTPSNASGSLSAGKKKDGSSLKAHFLTKKGRKLLGKWKEMFLVLDPKEGELHFYEKEGHHRAKGLLDLVHCKVYPVHRSLTGMLESFCVRSQYAREEQLWYLTCKNPDTSRVCSCLETFIKILTFETMKPFCDSS